MHTAPLPLEFQYDPQQPPLPLDQGAADHLLLAQRDAEYQLLAACWIGETWEHGFTARGLVNFDLSILAEPVRKVLAAWRFCPLTDQPRRFGWLWALLFAHDLLLTAMRACTTALPVHVPALLNRIARLHAGRLALEALAPWLDDPLNLVHAGLTPILTPFASVAAGATTHGNVGIRIDNKVNNRDWLLGELLAARPDFVVLTDDLPDAAAFQADLQAAGLKAYLYSEKNA